ncbi:hypothetical protein ADL30_15295 [Streptomyces sp. NRRL S-1521]|nr:hypothetical protein ADL30_15295 [Streptomyces sp. NRRL S-1521]
MTAHRAVLDLLDGESAPGWHATVLRDLGDAQSLIAMLVVLGRACRRLGTLNGEGRADGAGR